MIRKISHQPLRGDGLAWGIGVLFYVLGGSQGPYNSVSEDRLRSRGTYYAPETTETRVRTYPATEIYAQRLGGTPWPNMLMVQILCVSCQQLILSVKRIPEFVPCE